MSINYCTVSENSVDGFCGRQRAKILAQLLAEKYAAVVNPNTPPPYPGGGHGISGWHSPIPGTQSNIPLVPSRPEPLRIDHDLPAYEQPYITVKIFNFLDDLRGEQTLTTQAQLEFVIVTNLEIENEVHTDISVKITELEM